MKRLNLVTLLITFTLITHCQTDFENIEIHREILQVQPMTGIVFWNTSGHANTDVISLEFSYMLFNEVISDSGVYNWNVVESKLDDISSRNHQAIFRFRYVYPGYKTSVPDYIINRADYNETIGNSEGKETHFPDWTNDELKRFTIEFYTKFAERYDNDPRLAFIQVGFGLWGEYHIYDGPFVLGETFPGKDFQENFFLHLDTTLINTPWSISIDASDNTYSPFVQKPELKSIDFGLFDDSFMHKNHSGYNTSCWNFFDRERYKYAPAGGEFSYYSTYDQQHVLDYPDGPYGKSFEEAAKDFHLTYIIGNDQPNYQTNQRIKDAGLATGYKFKIVSIKTSSDSSIFEIMNYGIAPIYYDAYITVNGVRSPKSLKYLTDGETQSYSVAAGAKDAEITIECDRILEDQVIEFYGTQALPAVSGYNNISSSESILYPNPVLQGNDVFLKSNFEDGIFSYSIYNCDGRLISKQNDMNNKIETKSLKTGLYIVKIEKSSQIKVVRFLVM